MKILRNGSERRIHRYLKRREKYLKKALEESKRREIAKFECDYCGCKFNMVRGEYTVTNSMQYVESIDGLGSVVEADCPFCGRRLESVLETSLRFITAEEVKSNKKYFEEVKSI